MLQQTTKIRDVTACCITPSSRKLAGARYTGLVRAQVPLEGHCEIQNASFLACLQVEILSLGNCLPTSEALPYLARLDLPVVQAAELTMLVSLLVLRLRYAACMLRWPAVAVSHNQSWCG